MASLRRLPHSRFWIACYTDHNGVQRQRSTKQTSRALALKVAETYEEAYRRVQTESQARRVVADIFEQVHGTKLPWSSAKEYFASWLAGKKVATVKGTFARYQQVLTEFERHLGKRVDNVLASITKQEVQAFRDRIVQQLSPASGNIYLKILRVVFADAWRDDLITENPAAKIKTLKIADHLSARRPFTLAELQRVLDAADSEWRGMILTGLYTAQRLGDIASLTWAAVDFDKGQITFAVTKTGRRHVAPLHPALESYLRTVEIPTDRAAAVFPRAFATVLAQGRTGALSNQFYDLLSECGLVKQRSKKANEAGPGRRGKRQTNALSFHSLRHTTTSLMKNSGVSESIAMNLVGHETRAISQNYTHVEESARRAAIHALPTLRAASPLDAAKIIKLPTKSEAA